MKNLTKIFLAVVALFAYACVTDTTEDLGVQVNGDQTTEITLSLEESRTQLGEKVDGLYPLYWSSEDKISVNGVESAAAVIDDSNPASATFTVAGELATPYCIAYPAAPAGKVIFAENQEHAGSGSFGNGVSTMYAYSNGGGVTLNHLTGVLKIGITGNATLAYAQISNANRLPIAGEFDMDFEKGEVKATSASKYVINYNFPVTADAEGFVLSDEPQYIHVAVPAGVYDELYVTLYDTEGGVMYATVKADDKKPLAVGKVREFSNTIVYAPNESVFVIKDVASLKAFAAEATLSTKDALFVADVDMTGEAWTPIESYAGTVHGNGYSIKGLTAPLFGTVYCSIKGLHLVDVNIEQTADASVAGLVIHITSAAAANGLPADTDASVEHCSVSGKIVLNNTNTAFVNTARNEYGECVAAGLIGRMYGVNVSNCVNYADIEVKQCYPVGHTTSLFPSVGGIVGYVGYAEHVDTPKVYSNILDVENHGDISFAGTSYTGETNVSAYSALKPYIGGILGCTHSTNGECEMRNFKNYGNISISGKLGSGVSLSGTAGYMNTKKGGNYYNYGDISVANCEARYLYIGGGVGYCGDGTALDNIHNEGAITVAETTTLGSLICGGLIGYQGSSYAAIDAGHSIISNSSNKGAITVLSKMFAPELHTGAALYYRVGGLAGWTQHNIVNCTNHKEGKVTCKGSLHNYDTSNYSICIAGLVGYKTVNKMHNSVNDADVDCEIDITKGEDGTISNNAYDATKVRLNLGGISGYSNLPCTKVTNNGNISWKGEIEGQLRMGGVFAQSNSVSANIPSNDDCVNNGAVTIKAGSKIGDQLMIGGIAAYLNKSNNCANNGAVTIEDNVSWSNTFGYIGGGAAYVCGTTTFMTNNAPLTIGKGCSMGTCTHNYIGGTIGQVYTATATDLENTAKGVITINESAYSAINMVGGVVGSAPGVKIDGKTELNKNIDRCTNRGAINYYATHTAKKGHYLGGVIAYNYEVEVSKKYYAATTTDLYNYGPIKVKSTKLYDVYVGGISSFLGGATVNATNYETGTIHVDAVAHRYYIAGVAQQVKDTATDLYNYGDITLDGDLDHTLYCAGVITRNNNYTRTRNSNYGDITVNATIALNNFVGGFIYDSGLKLTYIDCHNYGNLTLSEKAVVTGQTRWGGFVGKLETTSAGIFNLFDGCSNHGDIIIKGQSSGDNADAYTTIGGIYGTITGTSAVIVKNGLVNTGDVIFEGKSLSAYIDETSVKNRKYLEMGGFAGYIGGSVKFANAENASWTGSFINTGTIKYSGSHASGVRLGGFAGGMDVAMPVSADGQIINLGDVICTGTCDKTLPQLGIGGLVGNIKDSSIANAKVHCNVQAIDNPLVGMVLGAARTDANKVSNCEVGGTICTTSEEKETTDGNVSKVPVVVEITADNFQDYIYGGTTAWESTDYDGCSFLSVKPTI